MINKILVNQKLSLLELHRRLLDKCIRNQWDLQLTEINLCRDNPVKLNLVRELKIQIARVEENEWALRYQYYKLLWSY